MGKPMGSSSSSSRTDWVGGTGKVTGEGVERQGVGDDDNDDDVMAMFLRTSRRRRRRRVANG